ncbi:hypothetical protein OTU49_013557 [Cherax quadricarinatus]|uniref:Uncharacterized protein n=1 Tax=Cherax quadricarinatus TaxID=27406 RepID=A0AAW0VST3_CHEQU
MLVIYTLVRLVNTINDLGWIMVNDWSKMVYVDEEWDGTIIVGLVGIVCQLSSEPQTNKAIYNKTKVEITHILSNVTSNRMDKSRSCIIPERTRILNDGSTNTSVQYVCGFIENTI